MNFNKNSGFITPQESALLKAKTSKFDNRINDVENEIILVEEDIDNITAAVNQLANDKQDKLTAGQNITIENNVISATGGGSDGVTDVKVNGTTVVSDNVANIPVVGQTTAGVLGGYYSNGIRLINGDRLDFIPANESLLSTRVENATPEHQISNWTRRMITPNLLDASVRAALCDGKGRAYTEEERLAALLRLGCTVDSNGFVKFTNN